MRPKPIRLLPFVLLTLALILIIGSCGSVQHTTQASQLELGRLASNVPAIKKGIAKYYSPGMMERVARNRGMKMRRDVAGYAAVTDCRRIGQIVYASINNGPFERYQILDCSHPRDVQRHLRECLVIEVDYRSAVRNRFVRQGRAPAIVLFPNNSR
jgi:hypothetical protein